MVVEAAGLVSGVGTTVCCGLLYGERCVLAFLFMEKTEGLAHVVLDAKSSPLALFLQC